MATAVGCAQTSVTTAPSVGVAPTLGPSAAFAGEPDDAQRRAQLRRQVDCAFADLEKMEGLGEGCALPPQERSAPPPPPAPKPAGVRPNPRSTGEPPDWITRIPLKDGYLFGVGTGRDPGVAQRKAMKFLAAQLVIKVMVKTTDKVRFQRSEETQGGQVVDSGEMTEESISQTARYVVSRSLSMARVEDSFLDEEGLYHMLVSLDMEALARKREVLVEGVLTSVRASLANLENDRSRGRIAYESIRNLVSTLLTVRRLERLPLGKEAAVLWREPVERLRKLTKSIYRRLDLQLESQSAGRFVLLASLDEMPVSELPIGLALNEGLGAIPEEVETADDGKASVRVRGPLLGRSKLGLDVRVDPADLGLRRRVGIPRKRRSVVLSSEGPLLVKIALTGARGEERRRVREALEVYLSDNLGATPAPSSEYQLSAQFSETPAVAIRNQFSKTFKIQIRWRGGAPRKDLQLIGSSLAPSKETASEQAFKSLLRRIRQGR